MATHYGNRLNLDSGVAYGGPLTAVVIEDRTAYALTPQGRMLLEARQHLCRPAHCSSS
nr:hypothetical protein [Cereibacter changlensis]